MPELPEVETTRRGITPHVVGQTVEKAFIREFRLRWPIDKHLVKYLNQTRLHEITRRGKYLIFRFDKGQILWHLGMSGSLCIVAKGHSPRLHDHVDILFGNGKVLRFHDPRRFGAVVWTTAPAEQHKLLRHLGPEPLCQTFSGNYLYEKSRRHRQAIKTWIMDSRTVVGVGNIYANESLFKAGIHPRKAANKISRTRFQKLAEEIKAVLCHAIERGGTTLRDFVGGDGKPGYFAQQLNVYGRGGEPCLTCGKHLTEKRLAQRSTVYCTHCQPY